MALRLVSLRPSIGDHSLQTRFQLGVASVLFVVCLIAAVTIYTMQRNMLEREALRQTELVMTALQATRAYVREVLRPRMYGLLPEDHFVLEAMSTSFISRAVMDRFQQRLPEFGYRRVALNARNPVFAPNSLELEMIRYFQENPGITSWHGMARQQGQERFIRFEPVRFHASCLHCHGDPTDAPQAIVQRYGRRRGFGHQAGEIGGVVSISVPIDSDLAGIRSTATWVFLGILAGLLALYVLIWGIFQKLVVGNIHPILDILRDSMDDGGVAAARAPAGRDELGELLRTTKILAERLRDTRQQLREHAAALEQKVMERTEALARSHEQLQRQMRQRNRELHLLTAIAELSTRPRPLENILRQVLQATLRVIPARAGLIYLRRRDGLRMACQVGPVPAALPERMEAVHRSPPPTDPQDRASCDHVRVLAEELGGVAIPLCCRNQQLGVMVLTELAAERLDEPLRDLLLSIGNQVGITIESLQSIGALRRSKELLQSVFNGISDPLVLLDRHSRLTMVNQAFLDRHRVQREDVLGMTLAEFFSSADGCILGEAADQLPRNGGEVRSRLIEMEDGSWFDVRFYPVPGPDGELEAVVCFARDVTELKAVERKIRHTEKLAAVGQLAAGVAHEINNPLGVILCYVDLLKQQCGGRPQVTSDLAVIERQALTCRRIVTDLLNFSRSQHSGPKRATLINADIRDVSKMVEGQFAKRGIRIVLELQPDLPPCLIDSGRMKQVLLNLMMNAAQAIDRDGTIEVRTRAAQDRIEITVRDDGPGIPDEIRDRIFEPFFSTKEVSQGTGLGLSVSYGIIADHQGEITVRSRPGDTVFTITLPPHGGRDGES